MKTFGFTVTFAIVAVLSATAKAEQWRTGGLNFIQCEATSEGQAQFLASQNLLEPDQPNIVVLHSSECRRRRRSQTYTCHREGTDVFFEAKAGSFQRNGKFESVSFAGDDAVLNCVVVRNVTITN